MEQQKTPVVIYFSRLQDNESKQRFSTFAQSYLAHPAGWTHELVLAKKGYENHPEEWKERIRLLKDVPFSVQEVADVGYPIGREILEPYADRYVLLLTASSEILVDHWLEYYMCHADENRILGACGGWNTVRDMWKEAMWNASDNRFIFRRQSRKWLVTLLMNFARNWIPIENVGTLENPFSPFPFVGLRTTALLLPPQILETIEWSRASELGVKMGSYIQESGTLGLFGQAVAKGLELYVVGSDGRATPITEGYMAETFFCGDQKNLIIEDKTTRFYAELPKRKQRRYEKSVWGHRQPLRIVKPVLEPTPKDLVPCPVCGHKRTFQYLSAQDYNRRLTEEWFHYNKCEACFSLFITNPPENLGDYYASDYGPYTSGVNIPYVDWWLSVVKKHLPTGGTYCELGPGGGDFLRAVNNAGYSVRGIEMDQRACEFLQKDGVEMIHSDDIVGSLYQLADHDCIAASQVLEHLQNPIQVLKAAAAKLKPGGTMIVSMPNLSSFEAYLFRQYWWGVDAPRHQTLMTYETFTEIAKNIGFEIVEVSWDNVVAKTIDCLTWRFSFQNWRQAKVTTLSPLRKVMIKHGIKNVMKLLRLFNKKQPERFVNSYTVVLKKVD